MTKLDIGMLDAVSGGCCGPQPLPPARCVPACGTPFPAPAPRGCGGGGKSGGGRGGCGSSNCS